jgi:hypothetical protein
MIQSNIYFFIHNDQGSLSLILASINHRLVSLLWSNLSTIGVYHRVSILSSLGIVLIILYVWLSEYRHSCNNWIMERIVPTCISELVSEIAEHNEHKEAE